jgi:hypothetical protein
MTVEDTPGYQVGMQRYLSGQPQLVLVEARHCWALVRLDLEHMVDFCCLESWIVIPV